MKTGNCGRLLPEGFIGDDSGENISELNPHYAELTAHYWVLHNYLPGAHEDYLGFCHYRRFLDFGSVPWSLMPRSSIPFATAVYWRYFSALRLQRWRKQELLARVAGYDVILPRPFDTYNCTVATHFNYFHRSCELNHALDTLRRVCPRYLPCAHRILEGRRFYSCNCFTMRRELLAEYLRWVFELLEAMRQGWHYEHYTRYDDVRMPAFIMERFFSIWLLYQCISQKLRVLELPSYLLRFASDADPQDIITQGLRLASADQQADGILTQAFGDLPPEDKLAGCLWHLRRNPQCVAVLHLLRNEPGQSTLRQLTRLLQEQQC